MQLPWIRESSCERSLTTSSNDDTLIHGNCLCLAHTHRAFYLEREVNLWLCPETAARWFCHLHFPPGSLSQTHGALNCCVQSAEVLFNGLANEKINHGLESTQCCLCPQAALALVLQLISESEFAPQLVSDGVTVGDPEDYIESHAKIKSKRSLVCWGWPGIDGTD